MFSRRWITHFLVLAALGMSVQAFVGCGKKTYPNEKPVFKIKGFVTVDGKPVSDIQVELHDKAGPDDKRPTYPQGFTDETGNIRISTYEEGDGAPAGDYNVTFAWQEFNLMSRAFGGPDKLQNKYSDPKKTPFSITLGEGQPNDLGNVELTTKK